MIMKRFFVLACGLAALTAVQAQNEKNEKRETIEGNGNLVTREVSVQSFNALDASGVYELRLAQGDREGVKIEADENLHDLFQVRNNGSTLVIDMKKMEGKNLKSKNKMRVYVTFKSLKHLDLQTVGNVTAEEALSFQDVSIKSRSVGNINLNISANKLDLENKSVGNITLSGKAQDAVMKNNGVGSLNAGKFVVQNLDIENSGVGSAEVNAEKGITVRDSFLGKVKNRGAAPVRKMNKVVI